MIRLFISSTRTAIFTNVAPRQIERRGIARRRVGAGVQEQAELVGLPPVAGCFVRAGRELQVFDRVLHASARAVDLLVEELAAPVEARDDEAGVGPHGEFGKPWPKGKNECLRTSSASCRFLSNSISGSKPEYSGLAVVCSAVLSPIPVEKYIEYRHMRKIGHLRRPENHAYPL